MTVRLIAIPETVLLILLAVLLLVPGSACSCQTKTYISVCPRQLVVEQGQPFNFNITCMKGSVPGAIKEIRLYKCVANQCTGLVVFFVGEPTGYHSEVLESYSKRTKLSNTLTTTTIAYEQALIQDLTYVYQCQVIPRDPGSASVAETASVGAVPHPGRSIVMTVVPIKPTYASSDRVSLRCRAISAFNFSSRTKDMAVMHFQYQQQGSWHTVPGTVFTQDRTTNGYYIHTTYIQALILTLGTGCRRRFRCYASQDQANFTSTGAQTEIKMVFSSQGCPYPEGNDTAGGRPDQNPDIDNGQKPDSDTDQDLDTVTGRNPDSQQPPDDGGTNISLDDNNNNNNNNRNNNTNSGAKSSRASLWVGVAVSAIVLIFAVLVAVAAYALHRKRSREERHRREPAPAAREGGGGVRIVLDQSTYAPEISDMSRTSGFTQAESSYHEYGSDVDIRGESEQPSYNDRLSSFYVSS